MSVSHDFMNDNTDYEKFTQEIYQTLINVQGIDTIDVKHNVKLAGKSKQEHQIDVYWEYEMAGVKHRTAIECKNYNREVSIGKVRDFYSVLSDLTNVNGIMVTKVGYQAGAKKFADFYGINLKELRFPNDKDWKGRIKTIVFQMKMVLPNIRQRIPLFDNEWLKENIKFPDSGQMTYNLQGMADEIKILDESGQPITNFYELDKKVPHKFDAAIGLEHTYFFDNAYLEVTPLGRIKIKGIKYIYDVNTGAEDFSIDALETTKAILKDALTGEIKFFDKDGNVK
ncbi:hypothetical protein WSM22_30450 [Cytophagales bacterium WSM2-2]|nr:hypothetical protein WSM22_30450 [Cytophagales bacterium WSM2-2]